MTECADKRTPGVGVESLYLAYRGPLVAYLTRLVHDHAAAEDLCQETFLKAIQSWDRRTSPAGTIAWLYRIATNPAYDYLRRQRARPAPLADADRLASRTHTREPQLDTAELVHRALERL